MKRYVKIIGITLIIVLVIAIVISMSYDMQQTQKLTAIQNSLNTELKEYRANKALAEKYLLVYTIRDEATYQDAKDKLYSQLSQKLRDSLFSEVHYTGLSLTPAKYTVVLVEGTNYTGTENTIKIQYTLEGLNYNKTITNLIKIRDGIIVSVERIF